MRPLKLLIDAAAAILAFSSAPLARWFDARRAATRSRKQQLLEQAAPERFLQESIGRVVVTFGGRMKTVDTIVWRSTKLDVFFIVDAQTERSPTFQELAAEVDAVFRRELLLSGYFATRPDLDMVSVHVMSRETYDSPWWR